MYIRSNLIMAMALGLAISSQAYASDDQQRGREGNMPPPPEFSSVDTNSDSEISLEEFSSQELPGGDADTIFYEMDTDGDSVVSKDEFESFKPPRPPRQ